MTELPPILMIDDNDDDFFIAHHYYERSGIEHPLRHFASGTEALSYFEAVVRGEEPMPAFVLLDINMPRMNGFETLERLRTMDIVPPPIVVMLTTSARVEDKERALSLGAREFCTKPMVGSEYVAIFRGLAERLLTA